MESSRRGFLKGASATAAALAVAKGLPAFAESATATGPVPRPLQGVDEHAAIWPVAHPAHHWETPPAGFEPATHGLEGRRSVR